MATTNYNRAIKEGEQHYDIKIMYKPQSQSPLSESVPNFIKVQAAIFNEQKFGNGSGIYIPATESYNRGEANRNASRFAAAKLVIADHKMMGEIEPNTNYFVAPSIELKAGNYLIKEGKAEQVDMSSWASKDEWNSASPESKVIVRASAAEAAKLGHAWVIAKTSEGIVITGSQSFPIDHIAKAIMPRSEHRLDEGILKREYLRKV